MCRMNAEVERTPAGTGELNYAPRQQRRASLARAERCEFSLPCRCLVCDYQARSFGGPTVLWKHAKALLFPSWTNDRFRRWAVVFALAKCKHGLCCEETESWWQDGITNRTDVDADSEPVLVLGLSSENR